VTATRAQRTRKKIELSLSPEARAALDELAPSGRRSELVDRLILDWASLVRAPSTGDDSARPGDATPRTS
jgi:hypothetical protein